MSGAMKLLDALNPTPTAKAPPIDRLWQRLGAESNPSVDRGATAGEPQLAARSRRGRQQHGLAWPSRAVVAVLVCLAVGVGGGAAILLHAGRSSGGHEPASNHGLPSPARGLVGILGVLRRPQTAADRNLGPGLTNILHHFRAGTPVTPLIRVARRTAQGYKIVLVPMRPKSGAWPSGFARSGPRLAVLAGGGGCCLTATAIENGQAWSSFGGTSGNDVVIVVPDRVTAVSVALPQNITARVSNNVAVLAVPHAVENLGIYPMTWFGPGGAVVKRFESSLPQPPTPRQAAADRRQALHADERANARITRQILQDFPLFRADSRPHTFGAGGARFTISRPGLARLPTYVLDAGYGPGYRLDVRDARLLTTTSGLRLWLLAGRVICIYGPLTQNAVCTATTRFGFVTARVPPHGPKLIVAIVPGANRAVSLTTPDGRATVTVHEGVAVAVARDVVNVRYKDAAGVAVSQRPG